MSFSRAGTGLSTLRRSTSRLFTSTICLSMSGVSVTWSVLFQAGAQLDEGVELGLGRAAVDGVGC